MAMTISGTSGVTFPDSTSMTTGQQACKAWVNFNGVPATPTISASYNVSSVSKITTGQYLVNMTNSMSDVNYSVVCSASTAGSAANTASSKWQYTTSQFEIDTYTVTGTGSNASQVSAAVFR